MTIARIFFNFKDYFEQIMQHLILNLLFIMKGMSLEKLYITNTYFKMHRKAK